MASAQEGALCTWLEERFCRSTVEIRYHLASEFGLEYSHSGCIKLLARLGFAYRKPTAEKPEEFIALYNRLLNDLGEDEAVYFADAVHPEYQTKPACGWVKQGSHLVVKTTAGCTASTSTARSILNLSMPLLSGQPPLMGSAPHSISPKPKPATPYKRIIHVIWDNAAYHKGSDVRAFLARPDCRLHLIQLPPNCPHLNPIERL